jgi:class 3 adenylate cyclase
VLATVLFTDIAGSTARAAEIGDRAWKQLIEATTTPSDASSTGGADVRSIPRATGSWRRSRPARAVRCATSVVDVVRELGLDVRAGIHTGEVEVADSNVRGIAVHIGSRVAALAAPGEVLVSRTVVDLVAGSGIAFTDRGEQSLKGVPSVWQLFAVEQGRHAG